MKLLSSRLLWYECFCFGTGIIWGLFVAIAFNGDFLEILSIILSFGFAGAFVGIIALPFLSGTLMRLFFLSVPMGIAGLGFLCGLMFITGKLFGFSKDYNQIPWNLLSGFIASLFFVILGLPIMITVTFNLWIKTEKEISWTDAKDILENVGPFIKNFSSMYLSVYPAMVEAVDRELK